MANVHQHLSLLATKQAEIILDETIFINKNKLTISKTGYLSLSR